MVGIQTKQGKRTTIPRCRIRPFKNKHGTRTAVVGRSRCDSHIVHGCGDRRRGLHRHGQGFDFSVGCLISGIVTMIWVHPHCECSGLSESIPSVARLLRALRLPSPVPANATAIRDLTTVEAAQLGMMWKVTRRCGWRLKRAALCPALPCPALFGQGRARIIRGPKAHIDQYKYQFSAACFSIC